MPVRGTKPKPEGKKRFTGGLTHDWVEVPDKPYPASKVPVRLPAKRTLNGNEGPIQVPVTNQTKAWWKAVSRMPHCVLWSDTDWQFALSSALVADMGFRGVISASVEQRQRERILGTTLDARRDLRIRYVDPSTVTADPTPKATKQTAARKDQLAERRSRRERVSSAS